METWSWVIKENSNFEEYFKERKIKYYLKSCLINETSFKEMRVPIQSFLIYILSETNRNQINKLISYNI
jgi:hypothetical protein